MYYTNRYYLVGDFCLLIDNMANKIKEFVYADKEVLEKKYYRSIVEIDNLKKSLSLNEIAKSFRDQDLKLKL